MNKLLKKERNKSGFTLVEIILALTIVAISAVLVLVLYQKTEENKKNNFTISQVLTIDKQIQNSAALGLTGPEIVDNIIKHKLLPENAIKNNRLINEWGGNIALKLSDKDEYYIYYYGVPKSSCINVIKGLNNRYKVVGSLLGKKTETNNISAISDFCGSLTNYDAIEFASVSLLNDDSGSTDISTSNSISISNSISASTSISTSVSTSLSSSNSTSNSISTSESISASNSTSVSVSNSISNSSSVSNSISRSESSSISISNSKSVSNELGAVRAVKNSIYSQHIISTNPTGTNSFSMYINGMPFFLQSEADIIKNIYFQILAAETVDEIWTLLDYDNATSNMYSIYVNGVRVSVTKTNETSRAYYVKNYNYERANNYAGQY